MLACQIGSSIIKLIQELVNGFVENKVLYSKISFIYNSVLLVREKAQRYHFSHLLTHSLLKNTDKLPQQKSIFQVSFSMFLV